MITLQEIKSKDRVKFGHKYEGTVLKGHHADIEINHSIRIYGDEWNHIKSPVSFDLTFRLGDIAEHGSYNLKYTGVITAIKEKYIEIEEYQGSINSEKHRLSIWEFSWRNADFNLEKISKENANTMQYI